MHIFVENEEHHNCFEYYQAKILPLTVTKTSSLKQMWNVEAQAVCITTHFHNV